MDASIPEHPLILASRVTGTPAFNPEGDRIGHVQDLSIDKVSGRVIYALLSCGGLLGIGDKLQPLPWSLLTYAPERDGYAVPVGKKALEKAPAFTAQELEDFGGAHRVAVDEFYGPFPMV